MIINSIVRELKANGDMSMDYLSHNVSENLKRIRQSKGMSLDQVAEQTGVSKSMLAQIEKGTANPSIGVLGKITSGLRIEFQRLIDPPRVDYALISPDDLVPTKELLGQYRVWTCFPYEDSREVEDIPYRRGAGRRVYKRWARRENTRISYSHRRCADGRVSRPCAGNP